MHSCCCYSYCCCWQPLWHGVNVIGFCVSVVCVDGWLYQASKTNEYIQCTSIYVITNTYTYMYIFMRAFINEKGTSRISLIKIYIFFFKFFDHRVVMLKHWFQKIWFCRDFNIKKDFHCHSVGLSKNKKYIYISRIA